MKWDDQEVKYSATEKEALAVLKAIEHFRGYVFGAQFTVITDAAALTHIKTMRVEGQRRLSRWALSLAEHDMVIKHRAGRLAAAPDALSRVWSAVVVEVQPDEWFDQMWSKTRAGDDEAHDYKIEGGKLFRYCIGMDDAGIPGFVWKRVVQKGMRKETIMKEHERLKHLGYKKCQTSLNHWCWWPRMDAEVKKVIRSCEVCKQVKDPNRKTRVPMGRKPIPSYPFQLVSIDHFGPLPRSRAGNIMLIVALDVFSKFIFLKPTRDGSGGLVAKFLEEEIFLKFGVPEILVSDNARAFMGRQVVELLNRYGIDHWTNAFYHPQANAAERYMRTIAAACRAHVLTREGDHRTWDEAIPEIQMALNAAVNDSTRRSPFATVFGHEYISSGTYFPQLHHPRTRLQESREASDAHFKALRDEVAMRLAESEERNRVRYDLRSRPVNFDIGERIWARNRSLSNASNAFCGKLDVKFIQGIIKDKMGRDVYWVDFSPGKGKKLHANDLIKD